MSYLAIFLFCQGKGIKRPKREHTKTCPICQGLLQIARQEHSDFISSQTIQKQLKIKPPMFRYHISILRNQGLISKRFGKLRSVRVERAYQIYLKKRLPARTIGWKMRLNSFGSTLRRHKASGWDIPASLFIYDADERRARAKLVKSRRNGSL